MKDRIRALLRSLRASRNLRRLEREERHYRERFTSLHLAIPGEAEIRTRLAKQHSDIKPKAKGDLHVLAIYHSYNWEGPSFESSLAIRPILGLFGSLSTVSSGVIWAVPT